MFHSLSDEHLRRIANIQLDRLRKRLEERKIRLEMSGRALSFLVSVGYDPAYGARPLKRAIQREVETPLARLLLKGEIRDGSTVHADMSASEGLEFRCDAPAAQHV